MAYNKGTEIGFSHNEWLQGSDIKIEAFGVSQKVGQSGALGLTIMSMNIGEIERTTEESPDGNAGTFTPQFLNIGIGYSKEFSNSIRGGLVARIVSESINDVSSQGFVLDAGIQYLTGFNEAKDNFRFGIALRNVGAPMKYQGEGLSYRNDNAATNINVLQEQRAQEYEMPSLISISLGYDYKLAQDHMLTFHGKSDKTLGLDYSYRATETFNGTHTFGVTLGL
jgi:hypothetical protein